MGISAFKPSLERGKSGSLIPAAPAQPALLSFRQPHPPCLYCVSTSRSVGMPRFLSADYYQGELVGSGRRA